MLVHEVMTTPVVTVRPDASLKEAVELLAEHGVTALPVVDEHDELVGMISEADVLLDAFLPDPRAHERPVQISAGPPMATVSQVMSRHLLTVPATADLATAAELMVGTVVKSLPVLADERVVGIVSRRDLIGVLARRDATIEAAVDDLIRGSGYDWTAQVRDGVVTVEGPEQDDEVAVAKVLVATVPGVVGLYFPALSVPAQRGGRD